MSYKLLIDECLSPKLAVLAREAGHHLSTCVRDRGWQGLQDHLLMRNVISEDFTLVTHNAVDFRGLGEESPGGLHSRAQIHAGLICLASVYSLDLDRQQRIFRQILLELQTLDDLVNKALDVYENDDHSLSVSLYEIPVPQRNDGDQ